VESNQGTLGHKTRNKYNISVRSHDRKKAWENQGVDQKIILETYLKHVGCHNVDWIYVAHFRDQ
jgi:hypothetical protein